VLMLMLVLATAAASASAATPASAPRERIALDTGWRLHRGDPAGLSVPLDYDVRPQPEQGADGRDADARPRQAERPQLSHSVLKPWILPTANRLIADPARRHVRPAGHPGQDVPFVQAGFDDSHWPQVDLPHDWAIAGPFLVDGE